MISRMFSGGLCVGLGAALLCGCGSSQPMIGTPAATLQSRTGAPRTAYGSRPHGYDHTLLYLTAGEALMAYRYPKGQSHGTVAYFGSLDGLCSDKKGNIFVSSAEGMYEYAHDGASPIATLSARGACSRNPVTGSLAVCSGPDVAVFPYSARHGWLIPKDRFVSFNVRTCGYDNKGNLFVAGGESGDAFQFAELAAKSDTFASVTLDQNIKGAGQVQWDGSYITIEDSERKPSVLYRFSITGSTGQLVGSTVLTGTEKVYQFWIQGKKVVGATADKSIGIWNYPAGKMPVRTIPLFESANGVTVSAPPSH